MKHSVPYNEGAFTLRHHPPVRASSATYSVEDLWEDNDSAARVLDSGAATLDSATEPLTAAAGPSQADRHLLTVASTTGLTVGGRYWLSEDGNGEEVKILRVTTDTSVNTVHSLLGEYTTAATIDGLELSASFPLASANDEDNLTQERPFRVVWEYDVNGITRKVQEQIRVVRFTHGDIDTAEAMDLVRGLFPDLGNMVADPAIIQGWARIAVRLLRGDLLSKDVDPELFLIGDRGAEALAYKIALIAGQNGYAPSHREPGEFAEDMQRILTGIWQSLTRGQAGRETLDLTKTTDQATDGQSRIPRGGVYLGL